MGEYMQRPRMSKTIRNGLISGVSYNIASVYDNDVLDIFGGRPSPGAWVDVSGRVLGRRTQRWELVVPVIALPPGWFHIKNVGTGHLLRHDYVYNDAGVLTAPSTLVQSQHREQWQFQWTLAHSKCFKASTASDPMAWCIVNRLTRARLSPDLGKMRNNYTKRDKDLAWRLEIKTPGVWKIVSCFNGCLLEHTEGSSVPGTTILCNDKKGKGNHTWALS